MMVDITAGTSASFLPNDALYKNYKHLDAPERSVYLQELPSRVKDHWLELARMLACLS